MELCQGANFVVQMWTHVVGLYDYTLLLEYCPYNTLQHLLDVRALHMMMQLLESIAHHRSCVARNVLSAALCSGQVSRHFHVATACRWCVSSVPRAAMAAGISSRWQCFA